MNLKSILVILFFLSLFFETTLFPFPLVFTLGVLSYILFPQVSIVIAAFIAGIVLDSLTLSPLGSTSVALAISFIAVEVISKQFTLQDYKLILLFLLVSTYIYAKIFAYADNIIFYVLLYLGVGVVIFYFYKPKRKSISAI